MTGPAIRTQIDGLNEEYSIETALDCSDLPDLARQEFKEETDVNNILARYGVDGIRGQPVYTEIDYDLDLQQSLEAIKGAQRAIAKLPPTLRAKYGTWEQMLDGSYNGQLAQDVTTYFETQRLEKEAADAEALAAAGPPV